MKTVDPSVSDSTSPLNVIGLINNLVADIQSLEKSIEKLKDKPQRLEMAIKNYNTKIQDVITYALLGEPSNNLSANLPWINKNRALIDHWLKNNNVTSKTKTMIQDAIAFAAKQNFQPTTGSTLVQTKDDRKFQSSGIHFNNEKDIITLNQLEKAIASIIKAIEGTVKFLEEGTKQNPGMQIRIGFEDFNQNKQSRNNYTALKNALIQYGIEYTEIEGKEFKPILIIRPSNIKTDISLQPDFNTKFTRFLQSQLDKQDKRKPPEHSPKRMKR